MLHTIAADGSSRVMCDHHNAPRSEGYTLKICKLCSCLAYGLIPTSIDSVAKDPYKWSRLAVVGGTKSPKIHLLSRKMQAQPWDVQRLRRKRNSFIEPIVSKDRILLQVGYSYRICRVKLVKIPIAPLKYWNENFTSRTGWSGDRGFAKPRKTDRPV